ncbi:MAG: hypothetical protein KAI22_05100 [Gammaproteobacteria bacterium]|nr:hypothetical protein [Gammaproteobacteria bacterium]
MSKHLNLLQSLINNLSSRERVLVLLGTLSIIYILWDTFLIAPIQSSNNNLVNERMAIQEQIINLETRRILADGLLKNSKRKQIITEIKVVEKEIKAFDGKILERLQGRVAPQYMANMLNDVLHKNEALELLSVNNLPAIPFVSHTEEEQKASPQKIKNSVQNKQTQVIDPGLIGIFMHSLELQLQGNYLDILNYLVALEGLEWKIFWDQVNLEVLEYPKVKVQIKVHTFSLKDGWLSV